MTLTHEQLLAVRRALRAGARHTQIARQMNLDVGTISRIASDRKLRRRKLALLTESDLPEDDPPPDYSARRLRRCPGCGAMVYRWPCLACRLTGGGGATVREGEAGREGEAPAEPRAAPQDGETERRRDGETIVVTLPPSFRLSVPQSEQQEMSNVA